MASFTSGTTFTRMLRKQQAAQQNGESEVSREDFEAIMDDFLDNYEVVGKKMVPVLPGQSGAEKLESMRRALVGLDLEGNGPSSDSEDVGSLAGGTKRESQYIRERYLRDDYKVGGKEEEMPVLHIIGQNKEDKWDAETILSEFVFLEGGEGRWNGC
jgi:protein LTV1